MAATVQQTAPYVVGLDTVTSQQIRQAAVYVVGTLPAEKVTQYQADVLTVGMAESPMLYQHQASVYVLVKGIPDRRDLRAWTFTQDDHDFYVIQLSDNLTLVYDKATQRWARWTSPGYNYWRGADGCEWEGLNVACDSRSGRIWKIDPEGRLDYETTPIVSVITGLTTVRTRKHIPVYMAELTVSEGEPPEGIEVGTVGISLRTSDDHGVSYVDHGEVPGEAIGEDVCIRWYGLGLMKAPGRIFEITDTGYARRINGLDVEMDADG